MRRLNGIAVRARGVVLAYGSFVAIRSSTFEIPFGKLTAVIGPNGSGKSTLLAAIAGLIEPASGEVEVAVPQHRISFVMQSTKIPDSLPVSVGEVVAMGRYASRGALGRLTAADRRAVADAMERLGITDLARRHIGKLSGGQRQRALVAQGLAQDHDILLLDEPLTGIDLNTAEAIDEVIHHEIEEGCAVVMTTHDLTEAAVAGHVILVSGQVLASGPPEEVLTAENLREAYGPHLLHPGEDRIFLDDPAHFPVQE
ncbi:MAG: zinc ABC transporter ATP-binding protein AztA [Actinomycetes bacterium]|jgi:iron complex transport system ATP-binding protein|nr:MAG: metal ABC transporter ATP-binding protein [Actinomycetota bacterium]